MGFDKLIRELDDFERPWSRKRALIHAPVLRLDSKTLLVLNSSRPVPPHRGKSMTHAGKCNFLLYVLLRWIVRNIFIGLILVLPWNEIKRFFILSRSSWLSPNFRCLPDIWKVQFLSKVCSCLLSNIEIYRCGSGFPSRWYCLLQNLKAGESSSLKEMNGNSFDTKDGIYVL